MAAKAWTDSKITSAISHYIRARADWTHKTIDVHELGIGLVITVWWKKHPLTS